MEKIFNKKAKGITLVALVVTIVILLILAGVSLNLVLSNNGIITNAQKASVKSDNATVAESLKMLVASYIIDNQDNSDFNSLEKLNEDGVIDDSNIVDVAVLIGKKLGTGNGKEKKDVYVIEDNTLYYYNKLEEKTDLGEIDGIEYQEPETDQDLFDITPEGEISLKDYYSFYDGKILFSEKNVVIPREVNGIKVKSLANGMFGHIHNVERVVIPKGITEIPYECFIKCVDLKTVVLPSTLKNIGGLAFAHCSKLADMTIPKSVEKLGDSSLWDSENLKITIQAGSPLTSDNIKKAGIAESKVTFEK